MIGIEGAARDIAHKLEGTCKSLHEVLEENDMEEFEDSLAFCFALDDLVFCCETCSWWSEISQMSETEYVCEDCDNGG